MGGGCEVGGLCRVLGVGFCAVDVFCVKVWKVFGDVKWREYGWKIL